MDSLPISGAIIIKEAKNVVIFFDDEKKMIGIKGEKIELANEWDRQKILKFAMSGGEFNAEELQEVDNIRHENITNS